ncbi:MAG: hypothetical protein COU08_00550 [Candidatus Harrisonbacteria bacterium CG10_big_fil_rev_8_21_14_0_10_42_17]|uniref:Ribosomal RNA small subunit methyltransferase E n=1 Tax=Candidatus Harrisonbacteria bacterium CG10_big_fil_rev_8_21_14_0_10_42_17 TaxID=1974584 RepID=A0A2M6WJ91_9BACT|nr:MAG: hypothetical protein COU08_00550 [Candidatus Harrisonbacteria bacterium CG10_big_fil_rev_8_21_14_0_10_42_17]
MKLHRFLGDYDLSGNSIFIADKEVVSQLRSVLRMRVGDIVILGDGRGREAFCRIIHYEHGGVRFAIDQVDLMPHEAAKSLTLYCAILKKENFELIVRQATEIGIARIVPVRTERTVKLNVNQERLKKITKEASEQSGRSLIPEVSSIVSFEEALQESEHCDVTVFFTPNAKLFSPELLPSRTLHSAACFIGPEGGWSPQEIQLAKDHYAVFAGLGRYTLRAETAVVAATYSLMHALAS